MAVGANSGPTTSAAQTVLTTQGVQVTVGAPDIVLSTVFNCGFCRRIVPQAAGTVFVQRSGDSAPISYVVTAGQASAIDGNIVLIGGSTNHAGASAIALNLEV
jgi:hypothetical protein